MKYLTKTRFRQGLEYPIKLIENYKESNEKYGFLLALADGGFQIEELSRLHCKNGVLIEEYDSDISVSETNDLLRLSHGKNFLSRMFFYFNS